MSNEKVTSRREKAMTDEQVKALIAAIMELTKEVRRVADAVEIQTMGGIM